MTTFHNTSRLFGITLVAVMLGACGGGSSGGGPDNNAPTVSGTPPPSITVGEDYFFQPAASDPDGDLLTFSIEAKPSWASFNSATGALSGAPQSGDEGPYDGISIVVSDGEATDSLDFAITVEEAAGGGTAPENPIVYLASDDTTGTTAVFELFLVDPTMPGESVKINGPLVAGGSLTGTYSLSPDLTQVAYVAFQDTVNDWELYLVDLADPGTSTKVNSSLVAGGEVNDFEFSPDGSQIAYIADQDVFGQFELYLVDLANPGVSTRLNPDLPTEGDTFGKISFSPDGSQVLYAADQDVDGVVELFLADVAAPGTTTKVNGPIVDEGDVDQYNFSPDGATIVYIADQNVDGVHELYAVDVSNPGVSTTLNPPLVADGDLCTFDFSPDSTKVAYCADQDADGVLELYLVELAVPGVSMKVNPTLVADGEVQAATFRFGPDSDFIVYRADQEVDGDNELYRVEVATPGVSVKINGTLPAGGDVSIFRINPDGLQLTYVADQDTEGFADLYNVDLSTPGSSTKLNPQPVGTQIQQIEITEDGTQILYLTDHDVADRFELQRVDIASPGVATRVNPAVPAGGDIAHFAIKTGLSF